jgi:lycopene cyclase CruP
MSITDHLLATLPNQSLLRLEQFDRFWTNYRLSPEAINSLVSQNSSQLVNIDYDAAIAGGTLGIVLAYALQKLGWRVVVIEKGILQGRVQEWNISRKELEILEELELLTSSELESAIATEYNPSRIGFKGGKDIWVRDVLNLGVSPIILLDLLKQKFLDAGGNILEQTELQQAIVYPNGVEILVRSELNCQSIKARLLLDMMGHFSPIAAQARQNSRPDGICLVVGSCAQGLPQQEYGDLFYSFTPIQNASQYFWEAFPAQDGRTTYMFTYADLNPDRLSFKQLFDEYFHYLPEYQDVDLADIQLQRVLYGFFPSYQRSPLKTQWDRILQVGDSSGSQSPLSFGGFGALVRHLPRLVEGIDMALQWNLLSRSDLRLLQPYQPNLSVTWLFQESMRIKIGSTYNPESVNELLSVTFAIMDNLGDRVLKPFLQDVVQFPALAQTLWGMVLADPILVSKIAIQVGLPNLLSWLQHFVQLGSYDLGDRLSLNLKPSLANLLPEHQYALTCQLNSWKYGSGRDYS